MPLPQLTSQQPLARWRDERGVVLLVTLIFTALLLGISAMALFSGRANLLISENFEASTQAAVSAESAVNEALYRLSRQETNADAIVPDLTNANWEVEILAHGTASPPSSILSLQTADWVQASNTPPTTVQFKKDADSKVIFYDPSTSPATFTSYTLPNSNIPNTAHPVLQVFATGVDLRGAQRQVLAEVSNTVTAPPAAPLSSGVDVYLNGSGFVDGVNHDHRIYISNNNGTSAMYGDNNNETTDNPISGSMKDSGDDRINTGTNPSQFFYYATVQGYDAANDGGHDGPTFQAYPAGGGGGNCDTGVGNPGLNNGFTSTQLQSLSLQPSCARLYNKQISSTDTTSAWVGLQWVSNPASNATCVANGHSTTVPHWHGTNTGYASAIALSNNGAGGPTVTNDGQPPTSGVWTRGVFTWGANNGTTDLTNSVPPAGTTTNCSPGGVPSLVCRPSSLSHSADSFYNGPHFPYFQEFLGLDSNSFQNLLAHPDRTATDLNNGLAPHGFTYVEGNYTFNNSTTAPATNDFILFYVTGNLTINGGQRMKGLFYINGSLSISGNPVILGAVMVRGSTQITTTTGNMTLLYSRKAAELGIQAGHPWRILSWTDTAMQ